MSELVKVAKFKRLVDHATRHAGVWDSMEDQPQAFAILREYVTARRVLSASPNNALAGIVALLLAGSSNRGKPQDLADECYGRIRTWLDYQFFTVSLSEPIDATPLIPSCLNHRKVVEDLVHCEARFAMDRDQKRHPLRRHVPTAAECPRFRGIGHCLKRAPGYSHGFARIEPRLDLPWSDWSMLELCAVAGIKDVHLQSAFGTRQGEGDEAINRLAGGINRLNEIRSRLACRQCGLRLEFGNKFTVLDAAYRATVTLPCKCGQPSVYFNHCCGCGNLIDSRDSQLKDESNYFICISCASGEDVKKAGRMCPKCGTNGSLVGKGRNKKCNVADCQHEVELPRRALRAKLTPKESQALPVDPS
jgi:hypothetical protein